MAKLISDNYLDQYHGHDDAPSELGFSLDWSFIQDPLKDWESEISDAFKDILPSSTYDQLSDYIAQYKDVPQAMLNEELSKQISKYADNPEVQEYLIRQGARAGASTIADKLTDQYLKTRALMAQGLVPTWNAMKTFKAPAMLYAGSALTAIIAYRMTLRILLPKRR